MRKANLMQESNTRRNICNAESMEFYEKIIF